MMAEGIHIVSGFGGGAKLFGKIPLGVQTVADKAFAAGIVAVGLHKPATGEDEAAFFDPLPDLGKHIGVKLLDPFKHNTCGAAELEIGIFLHSVQGGTDGGFGLTGAFLPPPQPQGIKVRIAHAENFLITECHNVPLYTSNMASSTKAHSQW